MKKNEKLIRVDEEPELYCTRKELQAKGGRSGKTNKCMANIRGRLER